MGKNYWMFVGPPERYEVIKDLGFTVYGVGSKYRRRAERMRPEDRVLFYVTRIRKWAATATITSRYFEDHQPIWQSSHRGDAHPYHVKLAPDIVLDERDYIDALILAPRLEYVKRWAPEDWPLAFFDSLHLLPQRDFRLIEGEMKRTVSKFRKGGRGRRSKRRQADPSQPPAESIVEANVPEASGEFVAETHVPVGPSVPDAEFQAPDGPGAPIADTHVPAGPDTPDAETHAPVGPSVPDAEFQAPDGPGAPVAEFQAPVGLGAPVAETHVPAGPDTPAAETQAPVSPSVPAAETHVPVGPDAPVDETHSDMGPDTPDVETDNTPDVPTQSAAETRGDGDPDR